MYVASYACKMSGTEGRANMKRVRHYETQKRQEEKAQKCSDASSLVQPWLSKHGTSPTGIVIIIEMLIYGTQTGHSGFKYL